MDRHSASRTATRLDERLLAQLPPFSQLSEAQIREVLDCARLAHVAAGDTVFREGDPAERFFMLLDGFVRVLRISEDGEQVVVLHIPAGQLFGIAKALSRSAYPATAEAASDGIVLAWPTALWDRFSRTYPGFLTETYKTVGERIGEMNERLVDLATKHVEQRVANALLRLLNQSGRATEQGIEIGFPLSRQDISEMTGTTLHTVSRLLSAWEKSGIVSGGRRRIVVCAPHDLVKIAEAPHP